MTNFIPIFPLSIVVFPEETLNLHIFEPRYKQLIKDCHEKNRSFGIPVVINKNVMESGTSVEILKIEKIYSNGEMDIVTRGQHVFRILEIIKEVPDKLYRGAIVNYPPNQHEGRETLMKHVLASVRLLHEMLNIHKDFKKEENQMKTYDIAHHAGLSLEQEYEFLGLMYELQRQEYLKRHLKNILPVVAETEALKQKIKMNGHFRYLN
ncbi:MAG: LON peptidase substrate-binding domain-containing protein [Chitinophagaceae bacterium]|nr:LON peptidase substrate-binding domain-containing protein [Chitinophagaceae bacterium]